MKQSIKLFAFLAEQLGSEVSIQLPEEITKEIIIALLIEQFPQAKHEISSCNVAINQAFVTKERFKTEAVNEIALIPPVSGG